MPRLTRRRRNSVARGGCIWCTEGLIGEECECIQYKPTRHHGSVCQCGHGEIWHRRREEDPISEPTTPPITKQVREVIQARCVEASTLQATVGPYVQSLQTQMQGLRDENKTLQRMTRELREQTRDPHLCAICLKEPKQVVFLPCKHAQFCEGCAKRWVKSRSTCPVCRAKVDAVLDIIL